MKPRIILFAKDPVPGNVKTRLSVRVGIEMAATVYRAMALDLLDVVMRLSDSADIEIHLDAHSDFFQRPGLPARLQVGDSLGAKLHHSLRTGLAEGAPAVVVLGSDTPALSPGAIGRLLESPADLAFGQATDGGFWGVKASRCAAGMFDGVRWSQPTTLEDCLAAALACGLSTEVSTPLDDLDTWDDLARLDPETVGPGLQQILRKLVDASSA
ncbi:MAG: DUF2064 domain-containing protein [Bryobacterales bacterium]|jgi:hypothetical protein|nr:DUF2064 domain-containing protein [Bryobacterales bacterium]